MNHDKYGHCVKCHSSLLVNDKNDKGDPIQRLSGKAEQMEVTLNDGSRMRLLICSSCKLNYSHEKHSKEIMQSVINGWEKDCDMLVADESKPTFDAKWKEDYMSRYSKKEII